MILLRAIRTEGGKRILYYDDSFDTDDFDILAWVHDQDSSRPYNEWDDDYENDEPELEDL